MEQGLQRLFVGRRDNGFLQRLTHILLSTLAQTENHRCSLLRQIHTAFQVFVYQRLIGFRPVAQMHGLACQVAIEAVGKEWCIGCHQLRHGLQTGVECGVCRLLVGVHLAAPEAFAIETDIPVAQVILHEVGDSTSCLGGLICLIISSNLLNKRVQTAQNPFVDFRILCIVHCALCIVPTVHIGIESKETVCIVERAEELAAHLVHALGVELEVIPRTGVGEHIPAHRVGTVLVECSKRIHRIAQPFRHLVAVLIQHQSVGNHILVRHFVLYHRMDGMERKEPTAGLVHTLADKVRRTRSVLVLKRIVVLRIRHSTRIKPYINEVEFALHRFAARRAENDTVHIRAVEVNHRRVVVLFRVVAYDMFGVRVLFHKARSDGLVYLLEEFLDRPDTYLFLSVLGAPDRQRRTPVTRAGEVPVVQVLEPLAETPCTR